MVFYKGGLSYTEAQSITIPELLRLNDMASKINKERERENSKNGV